MNNAMLPQWSIADTMADASTLNALAAWATALQAAEQKLDNDTRVLFERISRLEQTLGGSDIEARLQRLEAQRYQPMKLDPVFSDTMPSDQISHLKRRRK